MHISWKNKNKQKKAINIEHFIIRSANYDFSKGALSVSRFASFSHENTGMIVT